MILISISGSSIRINQQSSKDINKVLLKATMDIFQHRLRLLHTRSVQRIMNQPVNTSHQQRTPKMMKTKGQNITTYMRKFDIERQNLNLAKRIMQCESAHTKQIYTRQWKKNKNYVRVRSNFKKNLAIQQPKIIKYQPIVGRGSFLDILPSKSNHLQNAFSEKYVYSIVVCIGNHQIDTSSQLFSLLSIRKKGDHCLSFCIPNFLKKKQISCKLYQVIQNQTYQKGKFFINNLTDQTQQVQVINRIGKSFGKIVLVAEGFSMKQITKQKENCSRIQYSLA